METYLVAKTDKQLGIALRLLYYKNVHPYLQTVTNEEGRIEFHIGLDVSREFFNDIKSEYLILVG